MVTVMADLNGEKDEKGEKGKASEQGRRTKAIIMMAKREGCLTHGSLIYPIRWQHDISDTLHNR